MHNYGRGHFKQLAPGFWQTGFNWPTSAPPILHLFAPLWIGWNFGRVRHTMMVIAGATVTERLSVFSEIYGDNMETMAMFYTVYGLWWLSSYSHFHSEWRRVLDELGSTVDLSNDSQTSIIYWLYWLLWSVNQQRMAGNQLPVYMKNWKTVSMV